MKKLIAVFSVLLFMLAFVDPSDAQNNKARAAQYFDSAVAAYDNHNYKEALEYFETAYELVPHWRVLAHIGTCYAKLNRPVRAINALERYLEEGGAEISVEERKAAIDMLEEQRAKVGTLYLHVAPSGTEVTIDGESKGQAPFEKILLLSGPHHVIIIDGNTVVEKDIRIEPNEDFVLRYPEQPREGPPVVPIESEPYTADEEENFAAQTDPETLQIIEGQDSTTGFELISGAGVEEPVDSGSGPKVSVPFFVALGMAGAGAILGGIGWGFYIENKSSVRFYDDELERDVYSDGEGNHFTYEDDCQLIDNQGVPVYSIPESPWEKKQGVFCTREFKRRSFEDNARRALIPAVVGTSLAVIGGATALVFAFNPEWFESEEDTNGPDLALTPITAPGYTGMSFSGRF